jgi:hypothetical protein
MHRLLLLVILAAASLPAWAGVTYTAVTRTIVGSRSSANDFRVRGWVSGNRARMEFLQSQLPEIQSGTYLISNDGGETVYLVKPSQRTSELWDVNGMVSNMADMMRTFRTEMKVRFEEPKVEKLLEENGPVMHGMSTKHFRFRTSYKAYVEIFDKQTISTVMEEEIWTTSDIKEPGIKAFLEKHPSTGDEQLDRILEQEMSKVPGFPLKRTTSTQTETEKRTTVSRTEMEIVELKTVTTPRSLFTIPKSYKEVEPEHTGATRAMTELKSEIRSGPN